MPTGDAQVKAKLREFGEPARATDASSMSVFVGLFPRCASSAKDPTRGGTDCGPSWPAARSPAPKSHLAQDMNDLPRGTAPTLDAKRQESTGDEACRPCAALSTCSRLSPSGPLLYRRSGGAAGGTSQDCRMVGDQAAYITLALADPLCVRSLARANQRLAEALDTQRDSALPLR